MKDRSGFTTNTRYLDGGNGELSSFYSADVPGATPEIVVGMVTEKNRTLNLNTTGSRVIDHVRLSIH